MLAGNHARGRRGEQSGGHLWALIFAVGFGAVGCEDGSQAPRTPQSTAPHGPGSGYSSPFAAQYGSSYAPAYGWPPPGQPMPPPAPERRRLDLTLDVPTAAATPVPAWLDTRDPFPGGPGVDRRIDATSGAAPTPVVTTTRQLPVTHLLVALSVEKLGNHAARANAARKVLASRGAVKRSDNLWEMPSDGPEKSADAVRTELVKLLCFDDRAALFFADGGRMVKLEAAGQQPCEGGK